MRFEQCTLESDLYCGTSPLPSGMDLQRAVAVPGAFQDKKVDMSLTGPGHHRQWNTLRGGKCSLKQWNMKCAQKSPFAYSNQLRAHTRVEKRAIFCKICFTENKCFLSELSLHTVNSDRNHWFRAKVSHQKRASAVQVDSGALRG